MIQNEVGNHAYRSLLLACLVRDDVLVCLLLGLSNMKVKLIYLSCRKQICRNQAHTSFHQVALTVQNFWKSPLPLQTQTWHSIPQAFCAKCSERSVSTSIVISMQVLSGVTLERYFCNDCYIANIRYENLLITLMLPMYASIKPKVASS